MRRLFHKMNFFPRSLDYGENGRQRFFDGNRWPQELEVSATEGGAKGPWPGPQAPGRGRRPPAGAAGPWPEVTLTGQGK